MSVSPELLLMLLADARLPVAGHTQSAGLEPAIAAGLLTAEVSSYAGSRLTTVTRVEAGTAVVARAQLLAGHGTAQVERAWAARTPSPALRRTSRDQGRALQRLSTRLWPDTDLLAWLPAQPPRPLVLGAVAATLGLEPVSLARLVGYDDVQTVASAALKLLPLDPAVTTGWVHDALPAIEELATAVASLTQPDQIPAPAAPQIELWAQDHAHAARRLFSA